MIQIETFYDADWEYDANLLPMIGKGLTALQQLNNWRQHHPLAKIISVVRGGNKRVSDRSEVRTTGYLEVIYENER